MQDPLIAAGVGSIVEVGHVVGRVAGVDPGGRYVAVARGGVVTVHDADAALGSVMSCAPARPFDQLAVRPGGESIAVLGEDLTVELWRSDGTVQRLPGSGAGRDDAEREGRRRSVDFDWEHQRGWLQFTADGSYLLFGETVLEGPARLNLLDAATLAHIDGVSAMQSPTIGETLIKDWGEGVEAACAAAPSTAVAFPAGCGDDTMVLAVAEVVQDRLRLYGAVPGQTSLADGIPGERVMGLALPASGELVVLDSDECLSAIRWRDPEAGTQRLASGYQLLRADDGEPRPLFATRLRALGTDDLTVGLNGPVFAWGRLLAVAVEKEQRIAGGWRWQTVGLVFLDLQTGQWLDFLDLPGAERHEPILIDNGIVHQNIKERTKISRWLPSSGPEA
ncbi:hypothetical protein [Actinomadura sp. HBU206391]|uniref:hypothetical protein n=1 Tax=Actinomadura sp. HBU206391 TaxID=2731692 RepID=UPI00164FEA08|nr:hypothetical protein [Actinomadura sp. HBU206391]MBC6462047.1 hypothetical protein [Actinomadura sp. HBU206391]